MRYFLDDLTVSTNSNQSAGTLVGRISSTLARNKAVDAWADDPEDASDSPDSTSEEQRLLSTWSRSVRKRIFDCTCVLLATPFLFPILLAVAIAVRLTSSGPVLFIQHRVGRYGKLFPILKFRTMVFVREKERHTVTTANNQQFTPIGLFLRRLKLDELPQVFNVLFGQMSLVGPRPKLPEHNQSALVLSCLPGITGAATVAFACEERFLAKIQPQILDSYYHTVVLPVKLRLDAEYMAQASFVSDVRLIVASVLRRWDNAIWERLPYNGQKLRQQIQARKAKQLRDMSTAHLSWKRRTPRNSVMYPANFVECEYGACFNEKDVLIHAKTREDRPHV
jgi:lipopolysaccharide/colanic/teichoic acid biosynthesis glycosyltransferase